MKFIVKMNAKNGTDVFSRNFGVDFSLNKILIRRHHKYLSYLCV